MKKPVAEFQEYLAEVAGVRMDAQANTGTGLPQHLTQLYALYRLKLGERRFLGIVLREPGSFQPARFEKHLGRLQEAAADSEGYCLIAAALPSYVRRRLVERRIPFVVPGRQMSWPTLGAVVEAGSRSGKLAGAAGDRLMPATQVVILYAINGQQAGQLTPKALAGRLGYTAMTMSRVLDEIEAHDLGRVNRVGRERLLDFPEGRSALWEASRALLRDPVRETVRVWRRELPARGCWWAGETALARYSLLTEPGEPVLALGRETWKPLAGKVERVPIPEPGTCQVQIWRYDPELLARKDRVDPFSLYLSLREEPDERVQLALEEMMEVEAWSEY